MDVTRDAMAKLIRAARNAKAMGDAVRNLSGDYAHDNIADRIAGDLADALQMMNGESLEVTGDFSNSQTYSWLFECSVPEDRVAGEFIRMAKEHEPKQPKPNLVSRVQFQDMVKKFGGYSAQTPEGEWK